MSASPARTLEEIVGQTAEQFAKDLVEVAGSDGNLRVAILKMGLRDIVWALASQFPEDTYEIVDQLDVMSSVVRESKG